MRARSRDYVSPVSGRTMTVHSSLTSSARRSEKNRGTVDRRRTLSSTRSRSYHLAHQAQNHQPYPDDHRTQKTNKQSAKSSGFDKAVPQDRKMSDWIKAVWLALARTQNDLRTSGKEKQEGGMRLLALLAMVFLTGIVLGLMTGARDSDHPLTFSDAVAVPPLPSETIEASRQYASTLPSQRPQIAMGSAPPSPQSQKRKPYGVIEDQDLSETLDKPALDHRLSPYGEREDVLAPYPSTLPSFNHYTVSPGKRRASVYDDPQAPWKAFAVPVASHDQRPMVAVVIDDLGFSETALAELKAMPKPLTLAFLPYAKNVRQKARTARHAGHELIVHMPMEALGGKNPGPKALYIKDDMASLKRKLNWSLDQFDGFVGINNHMGSRLTMSKPHMEIVINELKKRGLLFLDSRTHARSVAADVAAKEGVPHAIRHVFLDNHATYHAVSKQLNVTEEIAKKHGYAIAIGHPHTGTISALKNWLSHLKEKGIRLVPLSHLVALRSQTG